MWASCVRSVTSKMLVLWVAVYLLLNLLLNFGNKHLLTDFHFPLFVIWLGTLCYAPLCALSASLVGTEPVPEWGVVLQGGGLLMLAAALHAVTAATQTVSLDATSVALNQLIKAGAPAVTLALGRWVEGRRHHWALVVSTAAAVGGTALATYATPSVSLLGTVTGVVSTVCGGAEAVVTGILMRRLSIHPLQLTLLISLPASAILALAFMMFELRAPFFDTVDSQNLTAIVALAVVATVYTFVHYSLISLTSAHYVNLIGCLKVVMVVGLSYFLIEKLFLTASVLNIAGVAVTLAGFTAYSMLRNSPITRAEEVTLNVKAAKSEEAEAKEPDKHVAR